MFFKVYQGLEHFRNKSEFYTWLYRIAVNHCINYIRRQPRRSALSHEPSSADKGFYDHPYHSAIETEEFLQQVRDALSTLTSK